MKWYTALFELWRFQIKSEVKELDHLVAAILFALAITILLVFSFGDVGVSGSAGLFIGGLLLTSLITLQLLLLRSFEGELADDLFTQLRLSSLPKELWFVGKLLHIFTLCFVVVLVTFAVALFVHSGSVSITLLEATKILLVLAVATLGLASLGILLAAMTVEIHSRQLIYPILYYPLAIPVLIGAVEATRSVLIDKATFLVLIESWLGLVILFSSVFVVLGVLLYGELMKISSTKPN
jgi:heme exporter protein B